MDSDTQFGLELAKITLQAAAVIVPTTALMAALFREEIRSSVWPLKVDVKGGVEEPFISMYQEAGKNPYGFLRLAITNVGKRDIEKLQVYLSEHRFRAKDSDPWEKQKHFVPIRLNFSHGASSEVELLPAGMTQMIDVGAWRPAWEEDDSLKEKKYSAKGGGILLATEVLHKGSMAKDGEHAMEICAACEGGAIYKACWHLTLRDSTHIVPLIALKECKVFHRTQSAISGWRN